MTEIPQHLRDRATFRAAAAGLFALAYIFFGVIGFIAGEGWFGGLFGIVVGWIMVTAVLAVVMIGYGLALALWALGSGKLTLGEILDEVSRHMR